MKPTCVIQAPYNTRSGYGDMSRDIIRHIIDLNMYDVSLISMPWGACPMNVLDVNNSKDVKLINQTLVPPVTLPQKPDLFIQISVPNEFNPIGKYNIGITAGIETTLASPEWMDGLNRMDLNLTISEHSKRVFENTKIERRDSSGNVISTTVLTKPIEVLHNCIDTNIFKFIPKSEISAPVNNIFKQIPEDFCFLFVGHWLKGDYREDRKNIGVLIHVFCETFKNVNKKSQPALILKTSGANFSIMDQMDVITKIRKVRETSGPTAPNVYLIHGNLTDLEMNEVYNHPKVKAHVSFTKGEGFGRPLLEATQSNKPVIASGWSGQLDFLNVTDAILVGGELKTVEPGAVWEGVIIPQAQWFNVDEKQAYQALMYTFQNYSRLLEGAYRLSKDNRHKFSYEVIRERTKELLEKYVPKFATEIPFNLPMLRKVKSDG